MIFFFFQIFELIIEIYRFFSPVLSTVSPSTPFTHRSYTCINIRARNISYFFLYIYTSTRCTIIICCTRVHKFFIAGHALHAPHSRDEPRKMYTNYTAAAAAAAEERKTTRKHLYVYIYIIYVR